MIRRRCPQGPGAGGGAVPLRPHPGRAGSGVETKQRGRLVRAVAAQTHPGPFGTAGAGVPGESGSLDSGLPGRWVRRAGPGAAAGWPRRPRREVLELAVALKTGDAGSDRRAGRGRAGRARRVVALAADAATPLRRRSGSPDRVPTAAPPAVFGRFEADRPNVRWVGDAPARPARRRPQGDPDRVPRRSFPGGDGGPLGVCGERGRVAGDPARRPRFPRPPCPVLCGQRVDVHRCRAAPGVRRARDQAHPLPTRQTGWSEERSSGSFAPCATSSWSRSPTAATGPAARWTAWPS